MNSAIVIGGGFGGIAAALRLRAKGYSVRLLDRCSRLGGRAQVFERNGFRHDAGPTVITAPFLFDELFALFGKRREDYIEFIPLETWYRFHFPDGETFDYGGSIERTLKEISRFSSEDARGYMQLLDKSRRIFDVGFTQLADKPFHKPRSIIGQIPNLAKLGCYKTVWQLVSEHLKDERLRQAFSIHPLLVGGNPFETTSIYSLIHFLERKWGIYFAKGGTGGLVNALHRLLVESGVELSLGTTVDRILVEKGAAAGVELDNGQQIKANIIVSNADPMHLYRNMLEDRYQPTITRIKKKHSKLSMGLFVLFFGTKRKYPDIAHHSIWLGRRFKELLKDIFHGKELPEDFSLYLHRPTATDPTFAPDGCDSFYVLAPVPNLRANIDWEIEGPKLQKRIIRALDESILPDLEKNIVDPFYMTPGDFKDRYLSVDGAGFSVAPLFSQSAYFRFHNQSEGPNNLYLVGAGTHPGAGVPGVLCSAKVLDNIVQHADSTGKKEIVA